MDKIRDYQKTRLYRWEDKHVKPKDTTLIDYDLAVSVVNYIWQNEGLQSPPNVEKGQMTKVEGTANRYFVRLKFPVCTWLVIHELAHSMNSTIEDTGDGHGPDYLGIYMKLLAKYIPTMNLSVLMYTANQAKLDFNMLAFPAPLR